MRAAEIGLAPSLAAAEPLTEAQEGLWYAQRLDPANPVFNTGQYVELRGALDLDAFIDTIAQVMHEADGLQATFHDAADGPRRRAAAPATLDVVSCTGDPDPAAAALAGIALEMQTPADLERDGPVLQRLYVLGPDRHIWFQRIHHIVIDGYGTSLLTRRVADVYSARVRGTSERTRPFLPYREVVNDDRRYRSSQEREDDRRYWTSRFDAPLEIAALAAGDARTAHRYHRHLVSLPDLTSARLAALADELRVSWPDVMVALAGAYLQRMTGRSEAVVGVPAMLRVGSAAARVPGMVMNVLPLRIGDADDTSLASFVTTVSREMKEARAHGRYRSEALRRELGLLGGARRLHGPLVNVLPFDAPPEFAGLTARLDVLGTGPVDDLTIGVRADSTASGLRLELDANPNLYTEAALAEHAERLGQFVERVLQSSSLAVPVATAAEIDRYVADVNRTGRPVPVATLVDLIETSMRRHRDSTALVCGDETLTYAELDHRSAALAAHLGSLGTGRDHVVAVCIPRSLELEIALVAVLRSGAAYLPLDTETPPARLDVLLQSAQPVALLTTRALRDRFPDDLAAVSVDEWSWEAGDPAQPRPRATPSDAAYLIFTSGSTGVPKGVLVEHRAIVNRLLWMQEHYDVTPGDRILQKTPATFDVSVWEFFLPLVAGGVVVMAPPDAHQDPAWIARLIREHAITTLHFVPSMLAQFLAEPAALGLSLARVFCSGEELTAALRDRFHQVISGELHNLYGPTEAAVDVSWWNAGPDDRSVPVPIGYPVWNTRLYVLDKKRRPVPAGVPGELYIGGVQLAREYLGQPELTRERFVPDPFGAVDDRLYRTGDVARWRTDGAIEYLGRADHQVKIRGQRIELGEVETALIAEDVAQAVVVAHGPPSDRRLVGYLQPRPHHTIDVPAVVARLKARLTPAMIPSAFVVLESLPLSRNGKVDRSLLPEPEVLDLSSGRAAETPTEQAVARIFAEALHLAAAPGADADFFALGGHSLLAAQVMRTIRQRWACELGLGVLFTHPTVSGLAACVDADRRNEAPTDRSNHGLGTLVRLATGARPPLFCIHPAGGIAWCYNRLARTLSPIRELHGVQARGLGAAARLPESLNAMALEYVDALRTIQPTGPLHLLGWSVGGIVAHAMAAAAEQRGEEVALLAMLDSYPSDRWRNEAPPDASAALTALLLMAGLDAAAGVDASGALTRESVVAALRQSDHALASLPDDVLSGVLRVVAHTSGLVRRHRHRPVRVPLLHFRAALDHEGTGLSPGDWSAYCPSGVEVVDVAARHPQMIGAEASRIVARSLAERFVP